MYGIFTLIPEPIDFLFNCDKSRMQLLLAAIKEISSDASVAAILSEMVGIFTLKKWKKKNNSIIFCGKDASPLNPKGFGWSLVKLCCVLQLTTGWWHAICIYLHGFVIKGSNGLHFLPLYKDGAEVWPPFDTFLSQSLGRWVHLSIIALYPCVIESKHSIKWNPHNAEKTTSKIK